MVKPWPASDRERLKAELGFQRWEGWGHLAIDADYLAFHQSDYRGAIANYEKLWTWLTTQWQREMAGPDILEGIALYALHSKDPDLAKETLESLLPRAEGMSDPELGEACVKLAELAATDGQSASD